ncbi:MAG: translocation/assembly module TamB domain-containing protein [Pseudomonadota bacterium]
MRRFLIIALMAMPLPLAGQSDDEGRLVRFIEDALSDGAARRVDLQGFRGALSSEASLDRLAISDADGVWLEIEGAILDWNRAAVLRGRIEIEELSAERVTLIRLPLQEDAAPSPEASAFALPDLPVSINVELAQIDRFELGEAVLGQSLAASASAQVLLSGGAGEAAIEITRLDATEGQIALSTAFDNTSQEARIELSVTEAQGGLAVTVLGIEGAPSVGLAVTGAGPVDEFAAEFSLATDGFDRLTGTATSSAQVDGAVAYDFALTGDLRPILTGDLETFLGSNAEVSARATQMPSGALSLDDLRVRAAAVTLDGSARLDAGGQPEAFDVTGRLAPPSGDRLALPGGSAEIGAADLSLRYDRAAGDAVTGRATLTGLTAAGFGAPSSDLDLDGTLSPSGAFAGDIALAARGLTHSDPAIASALGTEVTLATGLSWQPETGAALQNFTLSSQSADLTGEMMALPGDARLDITADFALSARDLSPFGPLLGQELGGAAQAEFELVAEALSGAFETVFNLQGEALSLGDGVPDGLLRGATTLSGAIARDETGVTLDGLELRGAALRLDADGQLSSQSAELVVAARLTDAGLLDARLTGPISFDGTVTRAGADAPFRSPEMVLETVYGTLSGDVTALPGDRFPITAVIIADLPDLAQLSDLAGQSLEGAATLTLDAEAEIGPQVFSAALEGAVSELRFGALPSAILAGRTEIAGRVAGAPDEITISGFEIAGQEITAGIDGTFGTGVTDLSLMARLRNAAILTSALPGALSIEAEITDAADGYAIDARARGPVGLTAQVSGSATPELTLDLDIDGSAPLALANPFVAPQTLSGRLDFDLGLAGPPDIGSLSGRLSTSAARLGIPAQALALESIAADARIARGSADLSLRGLVSSGGSLNVDGRVGFAEPALPTDLSITLNQGRFVDPTLYEAAVEAVEMTLSGGLAGSSLLAGQIDLGVVEIRVPETALGSAGTIPDIVHLGETSAERQTRIYAGLLGNDSGNGGTSRIGLNLGISAPGRVFLRGRGLDAELGGTLRVGGTTTSPVASGRFELIRGRLSILGQRLDLTDGSATLLGADPYLQLTAQTQSGDYTIFIEIEGPATAPDVSFRATPDLPQDEVLAQLFFGRSVSSLSAVQALQLADGIAGLAGGGSGVFGQLREGLGLDDLDIQTDTAGNAIVSAGRYLSENVYTDVTVDNDGTGVSLNIDLTPSVTARGAVTSDGESSLGVFFERDY